MWVMVFFDLPVVEKQDRKRATGFRHWLLKQGYQMLQWSVYIRPCRGETKAEGLIKKLKKIIPPKGSIRALKVTDKQYEKMAILLGTQKKIEKLGTEQILFF